MIVGGDRAIEMPVKSLYNTQLMLASINAAKDIYDQGQKRIDDFQKMYGDFYSPIAKDVDYWYNNTTKKVGDVIDYLYRNGIDPTRSAEGRAIIYRTIREAPVGELAKLKQSSDNAKLYQKAKSELIAKGLYSQDLEQFDNGGVDLTNWDTSKDGVWTRTSPIAYQTLQQFTEPVFQNMGEHDLTPAQAKQIYGKAYDRRYKYRGVSIEDAQRAIGPSYQASVAGNPYYRFYKEQAKKHLIASGVDPAKITDEMVGNQFAKEAIDANWKYLNKHESSVDPIWEMNTKHNWEVQSDAKKEANQNYRTMLQLRVEHPEAFNDDGSIKTAKQMRQQQESMSPGRFSDALASSVARGSGSKIVEQAKYIAQVQLNNIDNRINQLKYALSHPGQYVKTHKQQYQNELKRLQKCRPAWVKATKDGSGLIDQYGNPTKTLTTTFDDLFKKGKIYKGLSGSGIDSYIDGTSHDIGGEEYKIWTKYFAPKQYQDSLNGKKDVLAYKFGQDGVKLARVGFLEAHGKSLTGKSISNRFQQYLSQNRSSAITPGSRKIRLQIAGRGNERRYIVTESVILKEADVNGFIDKLSGIKDRNDNKWKNAAQRYLSQLGLSKVNYAGGSGYQTRITYSVPMNNIASNAAAQAEWLKDISQSTDVPKSETLSTEAGAYTDSGYPMYNY